MMLELHTLGQFTDAGNFTHRQTFDRQQQLVLLRLQSSSPCGLLAKAQETT
jgi:hypothetical protein